MRKTNLKTKKQPPKDTGKTFVSDEQKSYWEEKSTGSSMSFTEDWPFPGGGDFDIIEWSENGVKGGSILAFFAKNGEETMVQIRANTPTVRHLTRRFAPDKPSAALKRFGTLFVNGEPTTLLLDICRAYSSGNVPEQLSKKIAEATANLDYLWLQGYAEAIKSLLETIKEGPEMDELAAAREEFIKQVPDYVAFVKEIDWENPPHITNDSLNYLLHQAIKRINGHPNQINADHFREAWETMMRQSLVNLKVWPKTYSSCAAQPWPGNLPYNDVAEIIKALTEKLIGRGEIRPPNKSEVLQAVNALFEERDLPEENWWDFRRLDDALKSLGFLWLVKPKKLKRK